MENCWNYNEEGNSCWDYYLTPKVIEYLCTLDVVHPSFCASSQTQFTPDMENLQNHPLAKLFNCENVVTLTGHSEYICLPAPTLSLCNNSKRCPTIGNGMFDPLIGTCNPNSTCSYL